ncbi:MAG: molybdopterin-dependent oxidoreductase [Candidatus Bathyarchaeota archaeon]
MLRTVCDFCGHSSCPIRVYVDAGRIVKVEGDPEDPHTRGLICPQASAAGDIVQSKDRLTHPLLRLNKKNQRKKITWDEGLDIISSKLQEIKERDGPESLVVATGYARSYFSQLRPHLQMFAALYGTPNLASMGHVCSLPRSMGTNYVFGEMNPWNSADYANSRCIVLWGINPNHNPPKIRKLVQARKSGCSLIVIDPRVTSFAKNADIHLQPRPRTDGALALSMIHVIIKEGLCDKNFIKKWVIGFDKLQNVVKDYPPQRGSEITWITEKKIVQAATIYASETPSSIDLGNGLDQHTNNFNTIRAIASLIAITGNLDVAGGNLLSPQSATRDPKKMDRLPIPVGRETLPLGRGAHLPSVWKAVLEGQPYAIKGMVIFGGNPAVTDCDSKLVCKALSEIEFLVVVDLFMTATARFADIILPATSFLETEFYLEGEKIIDPPGEAWPDLKIIIELGKKMGFKNKFQKNFNAVLKKSPGIAYHKYLKNGIYTPSGKVELYSERLDKLGYPALPNYVEPYESPIDSNWAKDYPLVLTMGAKFPMYTHSQFRNIPRLKKLMPQNYVLIDENTASGYEIKEGEKVLVESPTGSLVGIVKTTHDLLENVVQIFHGFEEMNVNQLTSSNYFDTVTGSPGLKSTICRIVKVR